MKFLSILSILTALAFSVTSFMNGSPEKTRQALSDSLEMDREKYISLLKERIKGNEKKPVDSVFQNLQVLSGFPAENLIFAMKAWSIGLGVSCSHCHNTIDFSLDEKNKKRIAREMVVMGNAINEKLSTMDGLSKRPVINCITCHRGELKPALRIK